jgi:hypothetical protein
LGSFFSLQLLRFLIQGKTIAATFEVRKCAPLP